MSKRKNDEENLELDDSEKKKVKLNDEESLEENQIKGDRFYEQENFGVARSCYLKALKFDSLNVVHYDNLALTLTA